MITRTRRSQRLGSSKRLFKLAYMSIELMKEAKRFWRVAAVLIALSFSVCGAQSADSCQADVFVPEILMNRPSVSSPDGRYSVVLGGFRDPANYEGGWLRVLHGQKKLRRYSLDPLSGGIFLKWAPDSHAFFLMWSDGGQLGAYHVRVFRVAGEDVREVPSTRAAIREFHTKHLCSERKDNVYAVRWVNGSAQLMMVAEIYPTSDCGKDWFTAGYLVDTNNGRVMERYSEKEARKNLKNCPTVFWPSAAWDQADVERAKAAAAQVNSEP